MFAESGQSQPGQTLPSLCLSTPLCPPFIAIHTLGPGSKWLCLHESRIGFVLLHSIVIKLEKKSSKALALPFEKQKAREANNSHSPHPAHQHILSALLLKINSESDCCSPTSLALSWLKPPSYFSGMTTAAPHQTSCFHPCPWRSPPSSQRDSC